MKKRDPLSLEEMQAELARQVAFSEQMGNYNGWIGFSFGLFVGLAAMFIILNEFGFIKPP